MTIAKDTPIADITVDSAMQARVDGSDMATISEYAQAILEGAKFPPVKVVWDGQTNHLWDGFHTLAAHIEAGLDAVDVDFIAGTRRDAWKLALGANATHGRPRTQADKREAIRRALADEEMSQQSDRVIAKICRVDPHTVAAVKRQVCGEIPTAATPRDKSHEQPTDGRILKKDALPPVRDEKGSPLQEALPFHDGDGNAFPTKEAMLEAQNATLQSELQRVVDEKAVEGLPEFERDDAKQTIADLREELRQRDVLIASLKESRDAAQEQATQAIRQLKSMQKKFDAAGLSMKPAAKKTKGK